MSDGVKGQFIWHELMTTDAAAAVAFLLESRRVEDAASSL